MATADEFCGGEPRQYGGAQVAVFAYRCDSCGGVWAVYLGQRLECPGCKSKDRTHTASLDPALWITALANAEPKDRERMIRELKRGGQ